MKPLHPVLTIRLFADEKCFGPGTARLLERVQSLHSLRAAAQDMDMAYSKAWRILKTAEAHLGYPLLHSTIGGKGGGGAQLTPEGEALLAAYQAYCQAVNAYARAQFSPFFSASLPPEEKIE